jgi:hypothetical protein
VELRGAAGERLIGQLTQPGITDGSSRQREMHFVLPEIRAGQRLQLDATIAPGRVEDGFEWRDTPSRYSELSWASRPVLRYMYEALDDSTPERRDETYKVYHHVYDPRGRRFLTKGPGGLFPHHRGLFYGFNRISYGDRRADVWHCRDGEFQAHESFLAAEAGPVIGRHRLAISWHGQDGGVFAQEEREMSVVQVPRGVLIEFASRLSSTVGKVQLAGDPQHAGFQFRATQDVPDKTKDRTYYLRPDGRDQPGSFRNWPDNVEQVNLPWNALSFVVDDQRYTCCYLDHPENPKPARYSERDYGRFGSDFEYELDEGKPLLVKYRLWLQEGEMTVEQVREHSDTFVHPPAVKVQ